MKKIIIFGGLFAIAVLILLLVGAVYLSRTYQRATFICESGKSVTATFFNNRDAVRILLSDGRDITLARFISGPDETMYIIAPGNDPKNGYVKFQNKDNQASIIEKTANESSESETYAQCVSDKFEGVAAMERRLSPPKFSWQVIKTPGVEQNRNKMILTTEVKGRAASPYSFGNCPNEWVVVGDSSWGLLPDEITGAICMIGDTGEEFGIFIDERGMYVLKKGIVQNSDPEAVGNRDTFETIRVMY